MRRTLSPSSPSPSSSSSSRPAQSPPLICCRICHGRQPPLIRPCACRGTCGSLHASCLQLWIEHRQHAGMSMTEATTCELCLQSFAHRLEQASVLRFFLSAGSWRAWAHIAYLAFCVRRVSVAAGAALKSVLNVSGEGGERHCSMFSSLAETSSPSSWSSSSSSSSSPSSSSSLSTLVRWCGRMVVDLMAHYVIPYRNGTDKTRSASEGATSTERGLGMQKGSRLRMTVMLAMHYSVLLLLDMRLLLAVFRRWRAATTKVIVFDKEAQSQAPLDRHDNEEEESTSEGVEGA